MEVVEVNDYQCHSDGEEVVLLDLDKANGVEDSPEVHEVTVDDASGMDVIETCDDDDDSQDRMEITDVVIEIIPEHDSNNTSAGTVTDGDVSANNESNDHQTSEEKDDDSLMIVDLGDKVVKSDDEVNETEEQDSNTNDTSESLQIMEVTEEESDVDDKTVKTNTIVNETKKADGSLVLIKDNVTVTIPQHIAGRDMAALNEETLPLSGKRMLKPRYGVKVPYIHMTSQIVTQDEIAKELFERFQQKYPITRVEKKDKHFSMKLSQQLAHKILKTPDGKSKNVSKRFKKLSNAAKNELLNKKSEKINVDTSNKLDDKPTSSTNSVENNLSKIQSADVQESNNVSKESLEVDDSKHIEQITNTLQILDQSADQQVNNLSEDKNDEKISSNEELIAILEDFENIECADTNGNQVQETPKTPKPPVMKKKIIRSTTRTKRSKPKLDPELEKQIALKQLQEVSRPKRFDSLYAKRKIEVDKKLLAKNDLASVLKRKKSSPDDVPEVKIAIDQYIKSYTDKRQSIIKVEPISDEIKDEIVSENAEEVVPEIKNNDVVKARTMREINRLLGDEGAINMIYSLEKRRSPGTNNAKNILPSTRRMKKDLMLKTKLVKNAMLKMSSPATASMSTNRLGRRSDVCTISPENKCTRKTSIDSQGSDQSNTSMGNFSGRKTIPADESKIIRKHSSSSEASSVGDSPILPVPEAIPINNTPVKALRVYTRKNKNSNDLILFDSNDTPYVEVVSKGTNKTLVKTKNPTNQKVKKQAVPTSTKLSSKYNLSLKCQISVNSS